MQCLRIPLPWMQWRPPRSIVGGMRKSPGLIQPRETQTLDMPMLQSEMNHLNNCFHRRHCASDSCRDSLLPCSNDIPLQHLNELYLRISNTVVYCDPQNGGLAIGQGQIFMPHKHWWGKFKVPFSFDSCLDNQFTSASFNLQQLKLLILFTRHTAMAYDKWKWKIDHWFIKSTWHALPSPRWPSTISCQPGKLASLESHQSLVQEVEHNLRAIQGTIITRLVIHGQMYFIISIRIFILPCQRFKPKR